MREVAAQTGQLQVEQIATHAHTEMGEKTRTFYQRAIKAHHRNVEKSTTVNELTPKRNVGRKKEGEHSGAKRDAENNNSPLCTFLKCRDKSDRYYMGSGPIINDETQTVLLKRAKRLAGRGSMTACNEISR